MFRLTKGANRLGSLISRQSTNLTAAATTTTTATPSLTHSQSRNLDFPDYHPKDLRCYFLTDDEQYALCRMDNLADFPFPIDDFPGFCAGPKAIAEYYIMKDEWCEYIMQKIKDREDPGPNNVYIISIYIYIHILYIILYYIIFFYFF